MKCDIINSKTREKIGECTIAPLWTQDRCIVWVGSDYLLAHTNNFKNNVFDF